MTSTNYASLKIVNWDFVKKISARDLRLNKDPKIIRKLIVNFLNSSSLFSDPSFCPPELVSKYFQLLQISVLEMANHIDSLYHTIEEKNAEIKKLQDEKKKREKNVPKYLFPPVVFQCTFCSKMFKTRYYLNCHIKRRHPDQKYPIPRDILPYEEPKTDHIVKTVANVPELSQDLGPFKAEVNAMVDHFDTILKNEQTSIRTDFMEQFHKINQLVQESLMKIQEERFNTMRRDKGSTDASYSDKSAMNERLRADDDSSNTHAYSQHDPVSEETYYYDYSLEDGEMKKNTQSNNNNLASTANISTTNVTPTTTTTIKNGSPIPMHPIHTASQSSTAAGSSTAINQHPQDYDEYYTYSDDYYESYN